SWLGWGESRESDDPMRSMGRIFLISMHGLVTTFQSLFAGKDKVAKRTKVLPAATSAIIFALAAMFIGASHNLHAQGPAPATPQAQIQGQVQDSPQGQGDLGAHERAAI